MPAAPGWHTFEKAPKSAHLGGTMHTVPAHIALVKAIQHDHRIAAERYRLAASIAESRRNAVRRPRRARRPALSPGIARQT